MNKLIGFIAASLLASGAAMAAQSSTTTVIQRPDGSTVTRTQTRTVHRRTVTRPATIAVVTPRQVRVERHCPPGLAKRGNGCLPPGIARHQRDSYARVVRDHRGDSYGRLVRDRDLRQERIISRHERVAAW